MKKAQKQQKKKRNNNRNTSAVERGKIKTKSYVYMYKSAEIAQQPFEYDAPFEPKQMNERNLLSV